MLFSMLCLRTILFYSETTVNMNSINTYVYNMWHGGGNSTTAEEVSNIPRDRQLLFDMVTKRDFLEMEASLWLNGRSQNVAKGWLST